MKENHDWTGFSDTHFWGYLQEWLGIKPLVYGVSGRKWDDVPNQANQLKSEHGDGFDAIIIFMGTNDFMADVPIGADSGNNHFRYGFPCAGVQVDGEDSGDGQFDFEGSDQYCSQHT